MYVNVCMYVGRYLRAASVHSIGTCVEGVVGCIYMCLYVWYVWLVCMYGMYVCMYVCMNEYNSSEGGRCMYARLFKCMYMAC